MTPAIKLVEQTPIDFKVHQYAHESGVESYGLEAVEKLGQDQNQVFKTLVLKLDNGKLVVAIVPVSNMVSI